MPSIDRFADDELERLDACPWCHCASARSLFSERGFLYEQCRQCGLIYLQPRVRQEQVPRISDESGYFEDAHAGYTRRQGEKRLELLSRLGVRLPPGARVHEDGAGLGAFTLACKMAGYDASGNDLGEDAVAGAKRLFSVDLQHGPLEVADLAPGAVDLIASFNLLSHLYEPWSYARLVHDRLKPGGIWYVRTGNRDGIMKYVKRGQWSAPEHVFHYTRHVIVEMAAAANLRLERTVPAFDSDFPYLFFDFRSRGTSWPHRIAGFACTYSTFAWTLLGLPKDDVYMVLRRDD